MQKPYKMAILGVLLMSTCLMFSQSVGGGNPHGQGSLAVPVAGQFTSALTGPLGSLGSGTMAGTFNVQKFAVQNDASGNPQLVAVGNLVATLTNTAGQATTVVLNNVAAPVAAPFAKRRESRACARPVVAAAATHAPTSSEPIAPECPAETARCAGSPY